MYLTRGVEMKLENYVKGLKQKDNQAFEAVYHETKHAVFAMVLPIVRDRSLAEDVMQDTYIKMIENIYSYNKKYKFINWLLTIAKNTALDMYRKNEKSFSIDIQEADDLFISKESGVESQLEAEYYLSVLNKEEQQIVLLKVFGDMKHKDIAKLLNKPIGTVTWTYSEAIKKMRSLKEEDRDER